MIYRDVFWEPDSFNSRLHYLEDYEFGIRLLVSGHETHFWPSRCSSTTGVAEIRRVHVWKHGLRVGRLKDRSTWGGIAELEALLGRIYADPMRNRSGSSR
jgi:hypothetical protein